MSAQGADAINTDTTGDVGEKRPIRVLLVKGAYEPHGGTESVISGFMDNMNLARVLPHIAMLSRPDAPQVPPLAADPQRIPQIQVPWSGTLGGVAAARELARVADEWHIDVIHSHDSRSTLAAWLLIRQRRIPWIAHMHGWLGRTGILANQFHEAVAKRLQRRADIVIGGSSHTCSEVEHLGMRKMYVLPNGVALPDLTAVAEEAQVLRNSLGVDEKTVLCAVTARLHPGKGHTYLFEAIRDLRARGCSVAVMVIGDGDYRGALEQNTRDLKIAEHVHFVGRVPSILPYLAMADMFVLPSLKESLSIAVLEAMAVGLPVVTTRVGDFHTLIDSGNNGVLVEPGDAQALAAGIEPLLEDTDRRAAMGRCGLQTVAERFSVQAMTRSMEDYYAEAAGLGPRRFQSAL